MPLCRESSIGHLFVGLYWFQSSYSRWLSDVRQDISVISVSNNVRRCDELMHLCQSGSCCALSQPVFSIPENIHVAAGPLFGWKREH